MHLPSVQGKYFALLILSWCVLAILSFGIAEAHPGNTAADGGHYCWTRCEYWGEVYGERHFHGGGTGGTYEEEYVPDEPEYVPDDYDTETGTGSISQQGSSSAVNQDTSVDKTDSSESSDEGLWWIIGIGAVGTFIYTVFKDK